MMPGTNRHTLHIHERADIVRVGAFEHERQNTRFVAGRPDHAESRELRQRGGSVLH